MSTEAEEWTAFLALVPYFSACPGPPNFRNRLLLFLHRCEDYVLTRETLLLHAGLSFFADHLEADLTSKQISP